MTSKSRFIESDHMNDSVDLRPALASDAAELANVHLNSWREAYRGILPQEYLDRLPLSFRKRKVNWERSLSMSESRDKVFVAESRENGLVGFIVVTAARDERFKGWAEIGAIYLFEEYKGRGIGYRLLQESFDWLRKQHFENVYCWVLESNPTRKFYERSGAVLDAARTTEVEIGGSLYLERAYCWQL